MVSGCRLAPEGRPADIGIRGGRIGALGDLAGAPARLRLAGEGRFVVPGFVDAHVHLDKAYLLDRAPSREGTLAEAIRVTAEAKRTFTVEDIQGRARRLLDRAAALGTTAMRGHVEVDPIVGLRGVEAVLPLRAEYADRLDLQVCAFAQEGILQSARDGGAPARGAPGRRRPRRRVPLQRHRRRRARGPRVRPRARVRLRRGLPRRLRRRAGAPPRGGDRRTGPSATAGRGASRSATSPSWPRATRPSRRGSRGGSTRPGSP